MPCSFSSPTQSASRRQTPADLSQATCVHREGHGCSISCERSRSGAECGSGRPWSAGKFRTATLKGIRSSFTHCVVVIPQHCPGYYQQTITIELASAVQAGQQTCSRVQERTMNHVPRQEHPTPVLPPLRWRGRYPHAHPPSS